ncbi:MAG: biotin transporter BioY [Chloroflexi bacterium 13_1_40CM_4_68_4]|nr:MAG: biotin transporter BioY [Chloroflexi bacterium 13_1_40CM_4_68_4]
MIARAAFRPLALALVPDTTIARLALVTGGSLVIALAAQVAVSLPFSPVPVTMQTYAVLVVAAALGRVAAASVSLYILEGIVGLPVFAGGTSGIERLLGPTGGYLAGFIAAAFVVGMLAERGWERHALTALAAMLAGELVIYALGLPWLARFVPADRVLVLGLLPFIPGDLVKLVLAAATPLAAWRVIHPSPGG